ncbi:hypothetical protein QBC35DRAFT_15849 [Podospora australis]|uniref:Uncharacterized protein n=1 Tax=Podospora australis TaxID=1536484 RepID=A0AAN7AH14_9PEZI|nr:hypothetical protein QBC35DRAFT_15849 [Podospora australis]
MRCRHWAIVIDLEKLFRHTLEGNHSITHIHQEAVANKSRDLVEVVVFRSLASKNLPKLGFIPLVLSQVKLQPLVLIRLDTLEDCLKLLRSKLLRNCKHMRKLVLIRLDILKLFRSKRQCKRSGIRKLLHTISSTYLFLHLHGVKALRRKVSDGDRKPHINNLWFRSQRPFLRINGRLEIKYHLERLNSLLRCLANQVVAICSSRSAAQAAHSWEKRSLREGTR